eukprot:GCRY01001678.1.p1 GENE.GCRY01001678.1~~GCRY01001678.1.p1  ORF type:complete len:655 (-),score=140.37 GCRY01001678.1:526-2490(-)
MSKAIIAITCLILFFLCLQQASCISVKSRSFFSSQEERLQLQNDRLTRLADMKSRSGFLGRHLFASSSSTSSSSSEEEKFANSKAFVSDGIASLKQKLPRYTFSGESAPKEFDYDNDEYLEGLASLAIPGVLMMLLSLIAFILFCMCRCCCNTCGHRRTTKVEGYALKTRVRLRICTFVFGAILAAGSIIGLVGNGDFTDSVDGVFTDTVHIIDSFVGRIYDVQVSVSKIQIKAESLVSQGLDVDLDWNQFYDVINDGLDVLEKAHDYAGFGEDVRAPVLWLLFCAGAVITILLVVGSACSINLMACSVPILSCPLIVILWLLFSIHLPLAVLFSDVCIQMESDIKDPFAEDSSLKDFVQCLDNSTLSDIMQAQEDYQNIVLDALAEELALLPGVNVTRANVTRVALATGYIDQVLEFAGYSSINPTRQTAVVHELIALIDLYDQLIDQIKLLFDCEIVTDTLLTVYDSLCVDLLEALDLVMSAQFILAFFLLIGSVLGCCGFKRFDSRNYQREHLPEEEIALNEFDEPYGNTANTQQNLATDTIAPPVHGHGNMLIPVEGEETPYVSEFAETEDESSFPEPNHPPPPPPMPMAEPQPAFNPNYVEEPLYPSMDDFGNNSNNYDEPLPPYPAAEPEQEYNEKQVLQREMEHQPL